MSFWDFAKRREEGKAGTESADHGLHSIKVLKLFPYVDGPPQRELERERAKFLEIRVRPRNISHIRQWSSELKPKNHHSQRVKKKNQKGKKETLMEQFP